MNIENIEHDIGNPWTWLLTFVAEAGAAVGMAWIFFQVIGVFAQLVARG